VANLGVQPWERDLLAKDEMALNADAVDIGLDEHIYFSKEGTSGGRSFAGGGLRMQLSKSKKITTLLATATCTY